MRGLAEDAGWVERPPEKLGERELVRQADLGRLVKLAGSSTTASHTTRTSSTTSRRASGRAAADRRGVHLLTLHGAKGLEFEAVFLPRVEERELPIRQAKKPHEIAEERRLFYVGLTRAKRHLVVTWSGRPSRFLAELGIETRARRAAGARRSGVRGAQAMAPRRATADDLPAYVVFHNSTLAEIAGRQAARPLRARAVPGVGPAKLERYGDEVIAILKAA